MRIVFDMQGAQSLASRNRGIGRYTLSIVKAMIRHRGEHEILLALNGSFESENASLCEEFRHTLARKNIRIWSPPKSVAYVGEENGWRRRAAELTYESFLLSLKPDFIYITSLFEGFGDESVTSIHALQESVPVAVTLFDLIPYIYPDPYLENPSFRAWYMEKIEHLRRADLWLAISESSRQEGIRYLNLANEQSVNISTGVDTWFLPTRIDCEQEAILRRKYGLSKPFVLYTGGIDHRKNVEGLIRAFSLLPQELRQSHQLTIVCSIQPASREVLERLARQFGLDAQDVVFTDFVPDEELLSFYNLCRLFVFPSWHEGFGLPVLEAMRCAAPVIGSNTSSVPEVIGWSEALFDPKSDGSIAECMRRGLTDEQFRQELVVRAENQAQKFSWDESGRRAISAMESRYEAWLEQKRTALGQTSRPRLAYVSPLPPSRTGIADFSAQLLPALSEFYDIDVIVEDGMDVDVQFKYGAVRTSEFLLRNPDAYDSVLYHFGNSSFHRYMFPLLEVVPGVVALHDFFLSGIAAEMDTQRWHPGYWSTALYAGHGYAGVRDRHQKSDTADVVWEYPCSLDVIQKSLGLIVHSENAIRLARQWYGGDTADWVQIPLARNTAVDFDKADARASLGFGENDYLVCAFGLLGPTKLNHRLLQAWADSSLAHNSTCHLIFVGENQLGRYGDELVSSIHELGERPNVRITGWADTQTFHRYLAAADVGVQLRTLSRGETSATVLDCMNYAKATIVNANGSMADLDPETVWMLPDEFSDHELTNALDTLYSDSSLRQKMGALARETILTHHSPDVCAARYRNAIESFYHQASANTAVLARTIISRVGEADDTHFRQLATSTAMNFVPRNSRRQLLVDISELVQRDAKSGIQRVVCSLLKEWLEHPPEGFRVEPVYATTEQAYRYARSFTMKLMGFEDHWLQDAPIDYGPGDIFIGLDLQPQIVPAQRAFYQDMKLRGVEVKFVVYDLLCVLQPQYFVPGATEGFERWLSVVLESDGAICISKAVAGELADWINQWAPERAQSFAIDWFHLGADIDNPLGLPGVPGDAGSAFKPLSDIPTFLMVGTLEPRKGHAQVLAAFEQLWRENQNVNLVIVGKKGWLVENLAVALRTHAEQGKRLFWLESVTDEYLSRVYAASSCLVAASYGEGFGLPLIEAARHGLPIIARDLPVFREVAGEHAYYFSANQGSDLAAAIKTWLELRKNEQEPSSREIPFLTWTQSAQNFAKFFTQKKVCEGLPR
ncbi:glycosyltransferase [Cupriavidus sp. AcVe19-6a]|uniref:glycosyltransferase n=1 Tax=Cupriavidus sp. AcVe19-6a TaxID=2821358 RepID=UPI001AE2C3E7|nr:glycosyltransferase [Cupriavidus sp. AcVe19-6a]MBP0633994.1 glycosyltransferase [Cupriavidus sp. AcVe19-6a]